jgi:phage terminase small subunit
MLNAKQTAFVENYLNTLNATKAAIAAGYSAATAYSAGARLLKHVEVRTAIEAAMAKRSEKAGVTGDQVIEELRRIGFADIRKLVSWRPGVERLAPDEKTGDLRLQIVNEVELIGSDKIDDATASAISSISQGKDGELKIKFHSKETALVNLGKHLGLFREGDNDRNAPVTVNIIDPRSSAKAKK